MWHEIHWCRFMGRYALYVGTENGYKLGKLYSYRVTAIISAGIHRYKLYLKEE